MNPAAPSEEPALHGDLSRFAAAELLQVLGFLGHSGTLAFTRADREGAGTVRLRLRAGRLIEALSDGAHLRLGQLLVERYGVPLAAVRRRLAWQKTARREGKPAGRLGELLVEDGAITNERLREALDEAATRLVCGVLTWSEGHFEFWPGSAEATLEPSPNLGLEALVLEHWHATDAFS